MLLLKIILTIVLDLLFLALGFCVYMLAKNHNTFRKQVLIVEAIGMYHQELIKRGCNPGDWAVDYDDMESYDQTMWRLWDWGYTRILPKEKFEIIKPYINKEEKKDI